MKLSELKAILNEMPYEREGKIWTSGDNYGGYHKLLVMKA